MASEKLLQLGRHRAIMTVLDDPTPEPALPVVRVAVEARVAHNIKAMQKVTAAVLGELNHPGCHSGFDIRFDIVSHYAVTEKLDVIAQPPRAGF